MIQAQNFPRLAYVHGHTIEKPIHKTLNFEYIIDYYIIARVIKVLLYTCSRALFVFNQNNTRNVDGV